MGGVRREASCLVVGGQFPILSHIFISVIGDQDGTGEEEHHRDRSAGAVDQGQVDSGEYGNDSEYFRDLIRRDQERNAQFRALKQAIQEGLDSGVGDKTVKEIWAEAEQRYRARHG